MRHHLKQKKARQYAVSLGYVILKTDPSCLLSADEDILVLHDVADVFKTYGRLVELELVAFADLPKQSRPADSSYDRACHLLIERLLKRGISLIFDATNLSERNREHLYSIAERLDVRLILVRVEAPPEIVHQRLKTRRGEAGNKSDADWEVYRRMEPSVDKIHRNHYAVDTSRDITPILDKIVRQANR